METQRKILLNYIDEFDLTSCQNPPRPTIDNGRKIEKYSSNNHNAVTASPIRTERFDDWNEAKKYNRYQRDYDGSDSREDRGRSRNRERLKSRFCQRSRSRDHHGLSRNRFRQRSRNRDHCGRSKDRFRQRSRSRDRSGQSNSRFRQRHTSRDHLGRSESRFRQRKYDERSDRSGRRVNSRDIKHDRIDKYDAITYGDQYEFPKVIDYSGNDKVFQLKNLTYKQKYHKPSSTVTSSDFSKAEEATESLKFQRTYYPQTKDENVLEQGHSQNQMEENTNHNNLQSSVSYIPTNQVRKNLFANEVPHQNYTRNVSDYSVNGIVELRKYQQSNSTNAATTYAQHKQQNVQIAQSVSKIDLSKSHLDKIYRSGEYSVPSLYASIPKLSQKFRIPKKRPICTVTQNIHTTGNNSRAASENQQSNERGVYDSADFQYELSGNIDQRPIKTATINNNKSKKPYPTEIQGSIVKASSSVLLNDQTTVQREEEVELIFKTLISPSGLMNPGSLVALLNLCGKITDAGEMIQTPRIQMKPADTTEQNDINLMTTTKAEKIVKVKKAKRKGMLSSCRKSKINNRITKASSQNDAKNPTAPSKNKNIKQKAKVTDNVTKPILRNADTKPKLKADIVKSKKPHKPSSTIFYSVRRGKNTAVSYAGQGIDASVPESPTNFRKVPKSSKQIKQTIVADQPAKRVKKTRMAKKRDVTLHKLEPSDSGETFKPSESFSPTAGTRINKNEKPKVGAANINYESRFDERNTLNAAKFGDVKPKTEPSTIKNNNPEWHCMNQRLECLHCDKNTGISLANHYVNKHPDCEVFSCRLSPEIAEFLRNTTEEHKCERRRVEDRQPYEFRQRCYFCDKSKLYTKSLWLQHYSVHTGCYEFQCKYCLLTFSALKNYHACTGKKKVVRKIKYPPFHRRDGIVYGYICDLCNFTRFEQNEIEKHLRCEHEGEVDGKFKRLVLLTFPKKKKKHEVEAEKEALELANAIKAVNENKSLDPLISNDDNHIAIVVNTDDDYEIGQRIPKKEADIDDDEINDNIRTNLQSSTSSQVGYVEILPEITSLVGKVIIKKELDSQTTESLGGISQQQDDVVSSITQSTREVGDADIEESKSLIYNKIDAATAYKKIVIEATTPADNEECATESLNDFILSNINEDAVDMNKFNSGTSVQTKTDSDPSATVQQSNIQSPEIALTPSTFDETDFLKISYVGSLVQQNLSSPTPNESAAIDIAGFSNEIFTNYEFMGITEETVGSSNSDMTFKNILEKYEFETPCGQQLTSPETAKTSMMQEIVELPDKASKVSTASRLWSIMQNKIDNAADNLVQGIGLAGSDLYRCCLADCNEKYIARFALEMHLLSHDQSHTNFKCYHCPMACKTIPSLMHHIETHGIHRYFCCYCLDTSATLFNVWQHMREAHNQDTFINWIPLNRNKSNLFVVFPTGFGEEELVSFGFTLIERNEKKLLS